MLILKLTFNAQTKELKTVPPTVSRAVPVYDPDNIEKITLTAGSDRSRGVEMAAFIPKLVIAPIIISLDRENNFIRSYRPDIVSEISQSASWWEKFKIIMGADVGDHRDEIKIEWHKLPTDAKFIREYYETEFQKKNFSITSVSETERVFQFTFAKEMIEGSVYIEDDPGTSEADIVLLTVTMDVGKI